MKTSVAECANFYKQIEKELLKECCKWEVKESGGRMNKVEERRTSGFVGHGTNTQEN